MPRLIEEEVVKMQFDNRGFESGVKESLTLLDKLKMALHFKDINLSPLEQAFKNAENTASQAGFHIRDIWLKVTTQIENEIANKIVNATNKITKSLTIEGAMDGFNEYELKMGSVQTIMAGTGESLATVTAYLEELNTYSDKTIYSFKDMTDNIGKFTNAGVKLEDAVAAIKGVANVAALAGANSNEASRAMYNFSQALSAGYVKLIDWKSIENANMATVGFKDTLLEVAESLGTVKKNADGTYDSLTKNAQGKISTSFNSMQNFNDSLQSQWMNTEVLTKALEIYATDVRDLTQAEKEAYEQELKSLGFKDEQIAAFEELGIKAANSATEIKTFTMLMDTLKESIGSGWAQTWEIVIGDFEEAKSLWTSVGNTIGDAIGSFSDARNKLLKGGLTSGWKQFTTITNAAIPAVEEFRAQLTETAIRQGKLTEEEAKDLDTTEKWIKNVREKGWLTEYLLKKQVDDYRSFIKGLNAEEQSALGITTEKIAEYENFISLIDSGEVSLKDFTNSFKELSGRENIIEGLKNVLIGVGSILEQIKDAWNSVFNPISSDYIYNLTKKFKEFTSKLKLNEAALNSIKTITTILFQVLKGGLTTISTLINGVTKLILPILNLFDAVFGVIGELIAAITNSDGILGFTKKLEKGGNSLKNGYLKVMQKIADTINKIANAIRDYKESTMFKTIKEWADRTYTSIHNFWVEFTNLPIVVEIMEDMEEISRKLKDRFDKLGNSFRQLFNKAKDLFTLDTLNTVLTKIYTALKNFKNILVTTKDNFVNFFREIRSGKSIMDSFKDNFSGVIDFFKDLKDTLVEFFDKIFSSGDASYFQELGNAIHEFFTTLDADKVTAIVLTTVFGLFAINLLRLTNAVSDTVKSIGGTFTTLKNVINSYMNRQKSLLLQIAESIVIVAGALWVLSTINPSDMKKALQALYGITACISVLIVILTITTKIVNSGMTESKKLSRFAESAMALVSLAGTLALASFALKQISKLELGENIVKNLIAVMGSVTVMAGIAGILSAVSNKGSSITKSTISLLAVAGSCYIVAMAMEKLVGISKDEKSLELVTKTMLKMILGLAVLSLAIGNVGAFSALGVLAVVTLFEKIMPRIEEIVNYDYSGIIKGLERNKTVLKSLGVAVGIMLVIGSLFGKGFSKLSIGLLTLIGALGLLLAVSKLASNFKYTEMSRAITFLGSLVKFLEGLIICMGIYSLLTSNNKQLGIGTFIGISLVLSSMSLIAKQGKNLSDADLKKEIKFVGVLTLLVDSMLIVAGIANANGNAGVTFKSLAIILSAISFVLSLLVTLSIIKDKSGIIKSMAAISIVIVSLGVVFNSVAKLSKSINKDNASKIGPLILMTLATIASVMGAMIFLSKQPWQSVAAAGVAISVVVIALGKVIEAAGTLHAVKAETNNKRIFAIMWAIGSIIAVTLALTALSHLSKDANSLAASGAAIGIVLVATSKLVEKLGSIRGSKDDKMKYLGMATSIQGALQAIAYITLALIALSNLGKDSSSILAASAAISITLLGVSVAVVALAKANDICEDVDVNSAKTIIVGAIAELLVVAGAISALSHLGKDNRSMLMSAISIGIGAIGIGAATVLLGLAAKLAKDTDWKTSATIIAGAVVSLIAVSAVIYALSNSMDISAIEKINELLPALTILLGTFSVMSIALATAARIGKGADLVTVGTIIMGGLLAIVGIITVAAGIAGWCELLPGLEEQINKGMDILVSVFTKIGEALGGLLGGAISSFVEEMVTGFGSSMNTMMDNDHLGGFFDKVSKVDKTVAEGALNMAAAVAAFIGVKWLDAFSGLFGVTDKEVDFSFLGTMIGAFVDSIKGFTDDDIAKANVAAGVATALAEFSKAIPTEGGLLSVFKGKKTDLEEFGTGLSTLATGLVGFITIAKDITPEDVESVNNAIEVANVVSEFSKTLVTNGGIPSLIFGDPVSLKEFGDNLSSFGSSLLNFAISLAGLEAGVPNYKDLISKCVEGVDPLVTLSSKLNDTKSIIAKVIGDENLQTWSDTFIPFIQNLWTFVKYIADNFKDFNIKALINKIALGVDPLADLTLKLKENKEDFKLFGDGLDLDDFGKKLKKFGSAVGDFCIDYKDVDFTPLSKLSIFSLQMKTINEAASSIEEDNFTKVKKAIDKLADTNIQGVVDAFSTDVEISTALTTLLDGLVTFISERTISDKPFYEGYGKVIIDGISGGMLKNRNVIKSTLNSIIDLIKNTLSSGLSTNTFNSFGSNVSQGLANGIKANSGAAILEAQKLAKSVAQITKDTLQEKSPSRLSKEYGINWDKGLAIGIDDASGEVINSTKNLSNSVVSTTNNVISKISEVINSDIDYQPTIRPVVDMDNIYKSENEINKIFKDYDTKVKYPTSLELTKSVAGSFNKNKASNDISSNEKRENVNSYTFTQNNYSPKALSRSEIYRQTNNQIKMLRSVTV